MNLFFINLKDFFFFFEDRNLTHAKYSSTLLCLLCISEFLLTPNKIHSWISHRKFPTYIGAILLNAENAQERYSDE